MTELWTCPDCGRQFANRNQAHSCVTITIEEYLADASPLAVELYEAVEAAVRECGVVRVHPQRTRVAFINTMSFAAIRLARRWVDLSLITPTPIDDRRIRRVELFGPTSFGNQIRLESLDDLDADVRDWLCVAYARGLRETLDPTAPVAPVTGDTLERLRVPLASKVVAHGDRLAVSLPRYAVQAFAVHRAVMVQVAGRKVKGEIDESGVLIVDLGGSGLGQGDPVDITLTADC